MQHSLGFLNLVTDALTRIQTTDIPTVKQWMDSHEPMVLIDVREQDEWQQGHLPNALYLGKGIIERDIENLIPNRTQKMVLYCGGGYRSALAADNLMKMGYTDVYSLDGGYRSWVSARLPTSRDP